MGVFGPGGRLRGAKRRRQRGTEPFVAVSLIEMYILQT
jgi:hypothetical protein